MVACQRTALVNVASVRASAAPGQAKLHTAHAQRIKEQRPLLDWRAERFEGGHKKLIRPVCDERACMRARVSAKALAVSNARAQRLCAHNIRAHTVLSAPASLRSAAPLYAHTLRPCSAAMLLVANFSGYKKIVMLQRAIIHA